MGAAALGVAPFASPGTTRKRVGAESRCNSWRMIFSAAALTVKASIFLPMPGTSMRRLAPSSVHAPVPSSCAAELWPAVSSAETTECRTESMLGMPPATGAGSEDLTGAVSEMGGGVRAWPLIGTAGVGDGRSSSTSATGLATADCFAVGGALQPPAPGPKGEMGDGAGGATGVAAGRGGAADGVALADDRDEEGAAEPRDETPLATPLSNSSSGSRRWA